MILSLRGVFRNGLAAAMLLVQTIVGQTHADSNKNSGDMTPAATSAVSVNQITAPEDQAPLSARERSMLQRIENLEQELTSLKLELKKRLPGIEVQSPAAIQEMGDHLQEVQPSHVSLATKTTKPNQTQEREESKAQNFWGRYIPNMGFKVANTEHGDLNVSIYSYARYLNQYLLDSTYTNAFGIANEVTRRQDVQLLKVQIKFRGWVMSDKFRYFLYAWTSNANMGQGAQVVLAGNLNYDFNKHFTLGAGIYSLPGTRSVEGNFPFWLSVDSRQIADEFFRPSYTAGIVANGKITDKLRYQTMVGNNLSILGVSALQLDNGFNTFSGALVWTPTTPDFGPGFGDFEHHDTLAVRLAAHFTRSHETKESQPSSEAFENTQIRLADGSIIFTPNLFGPGITVHEVNYKMAAFDTGLKYRGFSLDGEYFMRWLDQFQGTNTIGLPRLFDQGFQVQSSAMILPKTLQAYVGGSTIYGKYGNPFDFRFGLNFFPFKNKVVRWNTEALYLRNSSVGYTSVPFTVGGNGFVFHTNLELAF